MSQFVLIFRFVSFSALRKINKHIYGAERIRSSRIANRRQHRSERDGRWDEQEEEEKWKNEWEQCVIRGNYVRSAISHSIAFMEFYFARNEKKSNSAACFHIDIIDFKCMHTMTVCECVCDLIHFLFGILKFNGPSKAKPNSRPRYSKRSKVNCYEKKHN